MIKIFMICGLLAVVSTRSSPQQPVIPLPVAPPLVAPSPVAPLPVAPLPVAPQFTQPNQAQEAYNQALRNWARAIILHYFYENYGYGFPKYVQENPEPRRYAYSYGQDDGHAKAETGTILNEGTDNESIAVHGSYSYVGDDGITYNVTYTADENGFQPEGEHIPPSAGVKKPKLGIPSAALASLVGSGLG